MAMMPEQEFNDLITKELEILMQETNRDVCSIIAKKINSIGKLSRTDAIRLVNLSRTQDLDKIATIIADASGKAKKEVNRAIDKAIKYNNSMMGGLIGKATINAEIVTALRSRASQVLTDDILGLIQTSAFMINGNVTEVGAMYNMMVSKGIYAISQGASTYNEQMQGIMSQMLDSGLRVVQYDSGNSRMLDSAVRMNLLDGIRQFNQEYRAEVGKQFGADGWEVSVHGMCAPDHLDVQGMQYSKSDFEELQESLDRPIGTCNCYHSIFPIKMGISKPVYSREQLAQAKAESNAITEYADKMGNIKRCTMYEATQKMRKQEILIRKLKYKKSGYADAGNEKMVKRLNKQIREQTAYYKGMSNQFGLKARMDRARAYKTKK